MNEILSYWDISLGLVSIGFGIFRMYKYSIYVKKRDEQTIRKGRKLYTYSRYLNDRHAYYWYSFLIFLGSAFIYNRLKGNLPNIVMLIKDMIDPY